MTTVAGLRHGLGEDRGRKHGPAARAGDEVPLVRGDVLDAEDAAVLFQLQDAVEQQERMTVGQDRLDVLDLEGKLERGER